MSSSFFNLSLLFFLAHFYHFLAPYTVVSVGPTATLHLPPSHPSHPLMFLLFIPILIPLHRTPISTASNFLVSVRRRFESMARFVSRGQPWSWGLLHDLCAFRLHLSFIILHFLFFSPNILNAFLFYPFLVACTRLYNPLCRSVRRSVGNNVDFWALLLLPNRTRRFSRVSGLVIGSSQSWYR